MIFDWWILIRLVCFCASRVVSCDHNYIKYNIIYNYDHKKQILSEISPIWCLEE